MRTSALGVFFFFQDRKTKPQSYTSQCSFGNALKYIYEQHSLLLHSGLTVEGRVQGEPLGFIQQHLYLLAGITCHNARSTKLTLTRCSFALTTEKCWMGRSMTVKFLVRVCPS